MSKVTTITSALQQWQARNEGIPLAEAKDVQLSFQFPPIQKMTLDLDVLENVEKLSLSTNQIDRIVLSPKMEHLKILALGRNVIKSFAGIEVVADTLEELWISYNQIDKMKGIEVMKKLRVLYMAHNMFREWAEYSKLSALRNSLEDLIFLGNPLVEKDEVGFRTEAIRRLPFLKKLDGEPITGLEIE